MKWKEGSMGNYWEKEEKKTGRHGWGGRKGKGDNVREDMR